MAFRVRTKRELSKTRQWVKLLDDLCSLTVKVRDDFKCRYPGCSNHWVPRVKDDGSVVVATACHWAHIFPRARGKKIRHDPENGLTLCYPHHMLYDKQMGPGERVKFLAKIGYDQQRLGFLEVRKNQVSKHEEFLIALVLRKKLEDELGSCNQILYAQDHILAHFKARFEKLLRSE